MTRERVWVCGVGLLCLALLATWIPHYLTWPWFRDLDTFATIAQSWDAGIRPYRDIEAYNFPGQTYLLWLLGKSIGWGHTAPFYVLDVVLVFALGAALAIWSRRCFATLLPGTIAYLVFLTQYLNLDYSQVAQRDWQATLFVVLSLITLQSGNSRRGRALSAILFACGLTFRPHVVLFLPAIWVALSGGVSAGTGPSRARAVAEWSGVFGLAALLAFAPLLLAGVTPDFVRGLHLAIASGAYGANSPAQAAETLLEQLGMKWTIAALAIGPLFSTYGPAQWRRFGGTWTWAMIAAFIYRPVHPQPHQYLLLPLDLIAAINVALLVAWLHGSPRSGAAREIGVLAIVLLSLVPLPQFCSVEQSMQALAFAFSAAEPEKPPAGSHQWLHAGRQAGGYAWSNYRDALAYLRTRTGATTVVANLLRRYPFPAMNGPAGRLSPFLAESGICWMLLVNQDLDAVFAESLTRARQSVVVWSPGESGVEPRMGLPRVIAVVRREYELVERFGQIEIWKRRENSAIPGETARP